MEQTNTENFDSTNEEQEIIDSTNDNEQTEDTDVATDESEESLQEEYTEREKQLYARLKKAEGFVQDENGKWVKPEAKPTPKPKAKKEEVTDELTLTRLEVRGVMETEDQNYVLRFAKGEGLSALEALNDPIVKDRLAANKRARESVQATPRSNNRASNQVDEVAAATRKYEQTGELPEGNPALTSKILKNLSNKQNAA